MGREQVNWVSSWLKKKNCVSLSESTFTVCMYICKTNLEAPPTRPCYPVGHLQCASNILNKASLCREMSAIPVQISSVQQWDKLTLAICLINLWVCIPRHHKHLPLELEHWPDPSSVFTQFVFLSTWPAGSPFAVIGTSCRLYSRSPYM